MTLRCKPLALVAASTGLAAAAILAAPSALADSYSLSPFGHPATCTNPHAPPFRQSYSIPVRARHQRGLYGNVYKDRIAEAWFGVGTPGGDNSTGNAILGWTIREQDAAARNIGSAAYTFASANAGAHATFSYSQMPLHAGATYFSTTLRFRDGSTCSVRWQMIIGK